MGRISSLVPRPLPDFNSQPWRKIGRRPGIKTTQNYVTDRKWWIRLVHNVESVCTSFDPRPSPDFSQRLRDKIWEWPGDEARGLGLEGCGLFFVRLGEGKRGLYEVWTSYIGFS